MTHTADILMAAAKIARGGGLGGVALDHVGGEDQYCPTGYGPRHRFKAATYA